MNLSRGKGFAGAGFAGDENVQVRVARGAFNVGVEFPGFDALLLPISGEEGKKS